jgi:hypothetical protein
MRHLSWLPLLLSAPTFCQTAPDNAAADVLKKRMESIGILKAPRSIKTKPFIFTEIGGPIVCAVPLSNVKLPAPNTRMPIINPPVSAAEALHELSVQFPAPACDEKSSQNK